MLRRPAAAIAVVAAALFMLPVILLVLFLGLAGSGTAAGTPAAAVHVGAIASGASAASNEALGALLDKLGAPELSPDERAKLTEELDGRLPTRTRPRRRAA